jgi:tyrosyl-tRNA synthetase
MTNLIANIDYIQGDKNILNLYDKPLNILWGVQPRDLPGLEFLVPIMQIVKFIKAGHYVTILLADIHELLDSPHLTLHMIQSRGKAYQILIQLLVELFDANPDSISYRFGSEFQLSSDYILDFYKISSFTTINETFRAREIDLEPIESDNSISKSNKKMTTMLYPILQSLDEKYVDCDVFYGSTTQELMCKYSEELMKNNRNTNKKVLYLLQDLTKKIGLSFFDPLDTIQSKLEYLTEDEIEYLSENILSPLLELRGDNTFWIANTKQIIAELLSKHLDCFYDKLIQSDFRSFYHSGWN